MKKLKMISQKGVTFEEGCNLYLDNCKERNLREGTINHYRQSYLNSAYKSGQLNISELARVCEMSRTTVYKYLAMIK